MTHIGSGDACAREAMVVHACAEGNVPLFRGWFDLYFEKDLVEQIYFTVPKQLVSAGKTESGRSARWRDSFEF